MQKFIYTIVCVLASAHMEAQSLWDISKPDQRMGYRLEAGMNVSSLSNSDASAVRTGYHIGGRVDYNVIKSLSICTGLDFTTKGFHSGRGKADLQYLQIPVLASYRLETPTGVKFHFNVGPYFAYGVGGKLYFEPLNVNYYYLFEQNSFGDTGFFKRFDIGFSAGAYILLGHVQLGVSYEYGFADIAKVYGRFHNRNVCVTAGYNF